MRLLLDTVVDAASALRRELALPPSTTRPADLVDAAEPGDPVTAAGERALLSDDPALLDQLLALPQVHLVVDGYNVTKTGFPELSLEKQRNRLVMRAVEPGRPVRRRGDVLLRRGGARGPGAGSERARGAGAVQQGRARPPTS